MLVFVHCLLGGRGFGVDRATLLGTLPLRFSSLSARLLGFGVGDRFDGVGVPALTGLRLLELALGGQRIVAGHRAGELFRLALHRVDQTFAGLVGFLMLCHCFSPSVTTRSTSC